MFLGELETPPEIIRGCLGHAAQSVWNRNSRGALQKRCTKKQLSRLREQDFCLNTLVGNKMACQMLLMQEKGTSLSTALLLSTSFVDPDMLVISWIFLQFCSIFHTKVWNVGGRKLMDFMWSIWIMIVSLKNVVGDSLLFWTPFFGGRSGNSW